MSAYGMTKAGDAVDVRRSGFAVDINTDAVPLDELDARIMPLAPSAPLRQQCRGQSCHQGRKPCAHPHLCLTDESLERVTSAARIGGGMQDVSQPVPLEHDRSGQYRGHVWANRVMVALAVVACALWLANSLH